jgi:TldD protein
MSNLDLVQQRLLHSNDLDEGFFNLQSDILLRRRVDFCDFYLQCMTTEAWSLDEGIIKSGSFIINQGIGIRAICGDKTFLSYSNVIDKPTITALVDNLFVEPVASIITKPDTNSKAHLTESLYSTTNLITSTSSLDKTNLLKMINEKASALEFVTNVIAGLTLDYDEIYLARSDARQHSDIRPLIHVSITIIINKHGKIEKGSSGFGGRYQLDSITNDMLHHHIYHAYNLAILKSEAITGSGGQMPVILGNGWAGVILHEAVGHGLEGDFNRKGSSAFSNKLGTQVASKCVTVIDEGCIPNCRGSLNIDDEGNPTAKNILIENGILRNYMFDELNASLMGTSSTGNGRRESFACSPMPRMTNTYMQNGTHTHEEIISSVKHGVYADSFEGGQVDITSGQFVFNASIAWAIVEGKLAYPIKGCALVGSGPECLKYVSMVGNNLELDGGIGTCGKNGQSIPVGVGQPTIRIDSGLIVGGGTN